MIGNRGPEECPTPWLEELAMRSQWQWISCVVLLLVVATVTAWLLASCGPRLSPASYDRIQFGMTRDEVDEIIGAPWGDYGGQAICFAMTREDHAFPEPDRYNCGTWTSPSYILEVHYDDNYRVIGKRWGETTVPPLWHRALKVIGIN
jgi:hypothetical protein